MNKSSFAVGLTLALAITDVRAAESRPNIGFILADDLGYMDVGCYNPKTFYETPHIDSLAKRGMRFPQGYAACCVCSPTRGSIMTGKYPPRFGITDFIPGMRSGKLKSAPNPDHLALEEVTIAEALRGGGYATFFAGKWHLGGGEFYPGAQGFPKDLTNGQGAKGNVQFWYPKSDLPVPDHKDDPKTTDRIVNEAVKFINEHKDAPFFAYLPFLAVHQPIGARPELVAKYQKKKETAPPDAYGQERERQVRLVQNNPIYAGMLEQLDSAIGRVRDALDQNGLAQKTIVVFMSDNGGHSTGEGTPTSNLPLRAGKGWPYEGGGREPMNICAPGLTKPGSTCDTPVISTNFYPTLLQLAGLPLKPEQHRDGVSLVPLLKGENASRGKPLFWRGRRSERTWQAVHDGPLKLVVRADNERRTEFLCDIDRDPGERTDLLAQQTAAAARLRQTLTAWETTVNPQRK